MKAPGAAPPWHDERAERAVVGCAVATAAGAAHAVAHGVTGDDLYDRRLGRVLDAAIALAGTHPTDPDARIHAVCDAAGDRWSYVEPLVRSRPVMADRSGYYAARVREAALRRRIVTRCAAILRDVGLDVTGAPEVASWT